MNHRAQPDLNQGVLSSQDSDGPRPRYPLQEHFSSQRRSVPMARTRPACRRGVQRSGQHPGQQSSQPASWRPNRLIADTPHEIMLMIEKPLQNSFLRAIAAGDFGFVEKMLKYRRPGKHGGVSLSQGYLALDGAIRKACENGVALKGRDFLHFVAGCGMDEFVGVIVKKIPVDAPDEEGRTPWKVAVSSGKLEVLAELIRHGPERANVSSRKVKTKLRQLMIQVKQKKKSG
ncbi:hypothetical protein VTO42DRAFT_7244 [Malbranchea cinnamomea]